MMAPIPKDTKDNPQDENTDGSGTDPFHNPNLMLAGGESDSSDEDFDGEMVTPGGYSLLPSEPGNYQEESDSEAGTDEEGGPQGYFSGVAEVEPTFLQDEGVPTTVLASEAESSTPTLSPSDEANNPAAAEKFPGKVPAYLHVPSLPRNKEGLLWNERRMSGKKQALDPGNESAILKAMSGFQLPPESIPAWAKNIPEEQWRHQIYTRITKEENSNENAEDAKGPQPSTDSSAQSSSLTGVAPSEDHWSAGQSSGSPVAAAANDDWIAEFPDHT